MASTSRSSDSTGPSNKRQNRKGLSLQQQQNVSLFRTLPPAPLWRTPPTPPTSFLSTACSACELFGWCFPVGCFEPEPASRRNMRPLTALICKISWSQHSAVLVLHESHILNCSLRASGFALLAVADVSAAPTTAVAGAGETTRISAGASTTTASTTKAPPATKRIKIVEALNPSRSGSAGAVRTWPAGQSSVFQATSFT